MKYTSRTTAYVCPGIQFVSTNPCHIIVVIVIVVFLIDRNCCFRKKQRCWSRRLFYLCKSHWAKTTWISEMKGHMIFKVAMSCHCWIEFFSSTDSYTWTPDVMRSPLSVFSTYNNESLFIYKPQCLFSPASRKYNGSINFTFIICVCQVVKLINLKNEQRCNIIQFRELQGVM